MKVLYFKIDKRLMKMQRSKIYLVLYDIVNEREFTKYFNTEFEKEKFKIKLRYSKKLIIVDENDTEIYR